MTLEEELKDMIARGAVYVTLILEDGKLVEAYKVSPYYRNLCVIPESEWEKFLRLEKEVQR
jgi:hypothetical protein